MQNTNRVELDTDDSGSEEETLQSPESLEQFLSDMHHDAPKLVDSDTGLPSVEWLKSNFKTKSATIRYLGTLGFDAKTISHHIGVQYQHAYNVLHQDLKRGPNEVYVEQQWQCTHTKANVIIDVIVRNGQRDPNASRILYRVCGDCAKNLIPGVTDEAIQKAIPGAKQ